jgi:hypothetical protein
VGWRPGFEWNLAAERRPKVNLTITVKMDAKCAECKKGGACDNGLCLGCTSKAIKGKRMKSAQGAAVAARFDNFKRNPPSRT